jgi:ATP-dependent helicase Lhr and Lhr-like helicase
VSVPSAQRRPVGAAKRRGRVLSFGMESASRWSLIRRINEPDTAAGVEHVARTLLRRYGVVFWRLLAREASCLPPWRDLLRVYRRLEARGEIRGGRFVAGFSGEQYALPEAVGLLRRTRREPVTWVSLSGADPLNLIGILTPGLRLPALTRNRVVYRDGTPVATLAGGKVQFLVNMDDAAQWQAQKRLLRSPAPPAVADLA